MEEGGIVGVIDAGCLEHVPSNEEGSSVAGFGKDLNFVFVEPFIMVRALFYLERW